MDAMEHDLITNYDNPGYELIHMNLFIALFIAMGAMDYDLIINYEIFTDELEWLLVKSIIAMGAMKFVIKMRFDWFTHPCIHNIE